MRPKFTIVFATDMGGLFGLSGALPWKNSDDLKHFNRVTSDSFQTPILLMGRNTFQSLPKKLEGRQHVVLSSSTTVEGADAVVSSIDEVLTNEAFQDKMVFAIGGKHLIEDLWFKHRAHIDSIYYTKIHQNTSVSPTDSDAAVYISESMLEGIMAHVTAEKRVNDATFYKIVLHPHEEYQYLNLLDNCLKHGSVRKTRNATTHSSFNSTIQFDLKRGFPLLTTKKVFMRGIFEELMFFMKGQTDSKLLEDKGVNIWKPNTTKEFISSCGLSYEEGDMGPMYGWNWKHFGATYVDKSTDYIGKGYDQIAYVLDLLKHDPFSRRILMTTYDPSNARKGVLYPCHSIVIQFYVKEVDDKYFVSMTMYQRSVDLACGLPFNIASNALLLHLICEVLNAQGSSDDGTAVAAAHKYVPDILYIVLGDIHIYEQHVMNVKEQLTRTPHPFPTLHFKHMHSSIESYVFEDIEIVEYVCHPPIKYTMVA
jgi:dihydrofolate reductase / thymidylate synthase